MVLTRTRAQEQGVNRMSSSRGAAMRQLRARRAYQARLTSQRKSPPLNGTAPSTCAHQGTPLSLIGNPRPYCTNHDSGSLASVGQGSKEEQHSVTEEPRVIISRELPAFCLVTVTFPVLRSAKAPSAPLPGEGLLIGNKH